MKRLIYLLALILLLSCNSTKKDNFALIKKLNFLTGIWENHSSAGIIYEEWGRSGDSVFLGKSYIVNDVDTIELEKIVIRIKDDEIYYIPSVKNQNDGKPILFKLISENKNEFVFENKQHDFPQRIIYIDKGNDSLYARIEGVLKNKFRKEEFIMKRKKK